VSDDEFNALTAKVGACTATLEEREAWKAEHGRRYAELLATQEMPPEKSLAERKRLDVRARQKAHAIEQRRLTPRRYHAKLQRRARGLTRIVPAPIRRVTRAPRSRRLRTTRTSHGPPGRSTDDDPLDPPPRVLYEHAAAFAGDRRVARWLEAWGDESLEGAA
jgi:hypothetical protein